MVFNVYFDPEVITAAAGSRGLQALIPILRGFVANCFIFDFEDYRCQGDIKTRVEALPDDFNRKLTKVLFATLLKNNRFICVIEAEYTSNLSDVDQALRQAIKWNIELFLTEQKPTEPIPTGVEVASFATYHVSKFEDNRNEVATNGRNFPRGGEMTDTDFLACNFGNMFRHAKRIEICDRLLGEKFSDSYEYTSRRVIALIESNLSEPENCEIVFHCGQSKRDNHFRTILRSLRTGRLVRTSIKVNLYRDISGSAPFLPHERYIWTDKIGLDIGRGMDLLDKQTGKNRDTAISLKALSSISVGVLSYARMQVSSQLL